MQNPTEWNEMKIFGQYSINHKRKHEKEILKFSCQTHVLLFSTKSSSLFDRTIIKFIIHKFSKSFSFLVGGMANMVIR